MAGTKKLHRKTQDHETLELQHQEYIYITSALGLFSTSSLLHRVYIRLHKFKQLNTNIIKRKAGINAFYFQHILKQELCAFKTPIISVLKKNEKENTV